MGTVFCNVVSQEIIEISFAFSNILYTPQNSSFTSVLQSSAQNLRLAPWKESHILTTSSGLNRASPLFHFP
uniref:Uncharacterized protein n=1 Tax=Salix viminalis TaxID=40686 RepID=A0A6N2N432_SALVM